MDRLAYTTPVMLYQATLNLVLSHHVTDSNFLKKNLRLRLWIYWDYLRELYKLSLRVLCLSGFIQIGVTLPSFQEEVTKQMVGIVPADKKLLPVEGALLVNKTYRIDDIVGIKSRIYTL